MMDSRIYICFFIVTILFLVFLSGVQGFRPGKAAYAEEMKTAYELLNPGFSSSGCKNRPSIRLIKLYQKKISPLNGSVCRFYPSCSQFAVEAVNAYGFLPALLMTVERVLYREVKSAERFFIVLDNGLMYNPVYFNYIFNPEDYLGYRKYFLNYYIRKD